MNTLDAIRDRSRFRNLEVTEQVQLLADHVANHMNETGSIHEKLDKIDHELTRLRWMNFLSNLGTVILLVLVVAGFIVAHWL